MSLSRRQHTCWFCPSCCGLAWSARQKSQTDTRDSLTCCVGFGLALAGQWQTLYKEAMEMQLVGQAVSLPAMEIPEDDDLPTTMTKEQAELIMRSVHRGEHHGALRKLRPSKLASATDATWKLAEEKIRPRNDEVPVRPVLGATSTPDAKLLDAV